MSRLLRFALVGHPVAHSASPALQMAAFRALGMPHTYEAVDCPGPAALKAAIGLMKKGGIAGLNVTAPYKRTVLDLVDEVDSSASDVGAANTLVRKPDGKIVAYNTDVPALAAELERLDARKGTAVIVGAGGAGAAALEACKRIGIRVVGVTTRSWSTSEGLYESPAAEQFRERGALTLLWPTTEERSSMTHVSTALRLHWLELAASADVIVQATSAGTGGQGGEAIVDVIPWPNLAEGTVVYDLVYAKTTPFLEAARARGLRAAGGLGMLVRQGALAFELWLGQKPPLDVMLAAAETHVK